MAKRDNPRLKERAAEKARKQSEYKTRTSGGSSYRGGGRSEGGSYKAGGRSEGGSYKAGGRSVGGSYKAGGRSEGGSYKAGGRSEGGSYKAGGRSEGGSYKAGGRSEGGSYKAGGRSEGGSYRAGGRSEGGSYRGGGRSEGGSYRGGGRSEGGSYRGGGRSEGGSYRAGGRSEDRGFRQDDRSRERAHKPYAARPERSERPKSFGHSSYNAQGADGGFDTYENPNLIIGRNPVTEAIKSGRTIDKILMQRDGEGSIKKIASLARERGLQLQYVEKLVLDKLCPGRPHQGIAAFAAAHDYADMSSMIDAADSKGEKPLIVLLDGLEDPHNLGAILRSADGAGAHGVVIPARRAVGLTEIVSKASAGAIEYVPVAKVSNLSQAMDELKESGLWIVGLDMDGEPYTDVALDGPIAVVIGGEGAGVSRLIREKCDYVVSIPMKGHINSLNASNAAAVLLYEARRQRDAHE